MFNDDINHKDHLSENRLMNIDIVLYLLFYKLQYFVLRISTENIWINRSILYIVDIFVFFHVTISNTGYNVM